MSNKFLYNQYSTFIKKHFGERVQKISLDGGFTCPNRDGTVGIGGCTFCNNDSFSTATKFRGKSITWQIDNAINRIGKRYQTNKYIAYFQTYSNTYGKIEQLKSLYEEAINHPQIVGISIGTRPDCVNDEILDYLETVSKRCFLTIEYGIESFENETLKRINRGHLTETSTNAIIATSKRNINICAHMIIGLPGENIDTWVGAAKTISTLPITFLKLHNLEIIKGTAIAEEFIQNNWKLQTFDEYVDSIILFLEYLNNNIVIERLFDYSPSEMRIAPAWHYDYTTMVNKLRFIMEQRKTYQGRHYK